MKKEEHMKQMLLSRHQSVNSRTVSLERSRCAINIHSQVIRKKTHADWKTNKQNNKEAEEMLFGLPVVGQAVALVMRLPYSACV